MIESIEFKLLSPSMIKRMAASEITKADLYDNDGFPIEGGVMDPRLGVIDPGLKCRTCGGNIGECLGHFGYIEFVRPVIHVLYVKTIYKILKSVCLSCGRVLEAKKKCPHCGEEHKAVKLEKPFSFKEGERILDPVRIRSILEKIPDDDLAYIGFKGGRPEWLIITLLPVPPVTVRPSITLETGERSEDDLTHKLVDMIRINQRLKENILIGAPDFIIEDLWELLQYHTATFFDNELSGIPQSRHRSGRALKTLAQRLKTKEGRFRQNLAGKRVNFSARTVISPDTSISLNEVGVPMFIARELTLPVAVKEDNIEELRRCVLNAEQWPGANYIIRPDGRRKKVTKENVEEIAKEISPGYTIERHLQNGDIVLFNRQPSLHRMSMMAHRVRVTPWHTFTLNTTVCPPYNADFDGDEMNLHAIQTEEAKAEAQLLMEVQKHIRSPRFGGPIIGCEQDHVSGLYLLTKKDTALARQEAFSLLQEAGVDVELPEKSTFTGKEIFSFLMPKGLNIEFRAKACPGCKSYKREDCPHDGHVIITNGKLKAGVIDMKAVGRESGKLIDVIEKTYGSEVAHKFIDSVSLLGIKYMQKRGFTLGLDDLELSESAIIEIKNNIEKSKKEVDVLIQQYIEGKVDVLPGMTPEESLEMHILRTLKKVADSSGDILTKDMPENAAIVMARSGARGGIAHLVQIAASVGQETVLGKRIHRGYYNRILPHFLPKELSAEAHGFVTNSYKSGMNIFEFFFDLMSGRENLMDKSLRTKHSGYMERRLMNALQDLKVEYDNTVRDNRKVIIQFVPGEDSIDPSKSEWGELNIRNIVQSIL